MIAVHELLSVPHQTIFGTLPETIRGFWNDTRTLTPGDAFLAIRGARDGHDFLQDALQTGASCAIVEKIHPEVALPQLQVNDVLAFAQVVAQKHRQRYQIISVTGSYGKTSTKDFLRRFFDPMAYATPENLNNILGITISLSQMDQECFGILEAGIDRPGEMAPIIDLLTPNCAVFTGIAPVHLSQFQDYHQLIREKAQILSYALERQLPCFVAARCWPLLKKVLPHGASSCVLVGENVHHARFFTKLTIISGNEIILSGTYFRMEKFHLPAITRGQIENFSLAATVAKHYGISDKILQERVQSWQPPTLRGETFIFRNHPVYLDAYNANPAAMYDALTFFDQKYPDDNIYVLGGMRELGPMEIPEHQKLADYFKNHTQGTILAIGPEMETFCEALSTRIPVHYFETTAYARNFFSKILDNDIRPIFLKGGHRYTLWELVLRT